MAVGDIDDEVVAVVRLRSNGASAGGKIIYRRLLLVERRLVVGLVA